MDVTDAATSRDGPGGSNSMVNSWIASQRAILPKVPLSQFSYARTAVVTISRSSLSASVVTSTWMGRFGACAWSRRRRWASQICRVDTMSLIVRQVYWAR